MGATGKTGTYVVEILLKRGHAVRAFVHKNDERSSHLQQQGAELVVGDLHNFMTMCYALVGPTVEVDADRWTQAIAINLIGA
jgi:NAD(P)H dehydrogenase (quinone)